MYCGAIELGESCKRKKIFSDRGGEGDNLECQSGRNETTHYTVLATEQPVLLMKVLFSFFCSIISTFGYWSLVVGEGVRFVSEHLSQETSSTYKAMLVDVIEKNNKDERRNDDRVHARMKCSVGAFSFGFFCGLCFLGSSGKEK